MPAQPPSNNPMADFGPNEWLVDELYQQYLADKNSVDQAWWEFFADYQPSDGAKGKGSGNGQVLILSPGLSALTICCPPFC